MKIRQTIGMLVATLMLLAWPMAVEAKHHKGGGGMGGINPELIDMAADELGLKEKVVKTVKDIVYEAQTDAIKLKSQVRLAKLALRRMLDGDKPNMDAVLAQVEEVGRLKTNLRKHQMRMLLNVRKHLTKAQLRKLRKLKREMKGKRWHPKRLGPAHRKPECEGGHPGADGSCL